MSDPIVVVLADISPSEDNLAAIVTKHRLAQKLALHRNKGAHAILSREDVGKDGPGILSGLPGIPKKSNLVDVHSLRLDGVLSIRALNGRWTRVGETNCRKQQLTESEKKLVRYLAWSSTVLDLSETASAVIDTAIGFIRSENLRVPLMAYHPMGLRRGSDLISETTLKAIADMGGYVGGDFKEFLSRSLPQA